MFSKLMRGKTRKIFLLSAMLFYVFGVSLAAVSLFSYRSSMLEERKRITSEQVKTVFSILNSYYDKSKKNVLSEKDAKKYVIETLRHIRYDDNTSYFWITDVKATLLLHPLNTEMEGKNLINFKDASGQYLGREFIKIYKNKGEGFIFYEWNIKPGEEKSAGKATAAMGQISGKSYSKVGYVKGFMPWGWIIGSGIYIDDINTAFWRAALVVGGLSCVVAFYLIALFATAAEQEKWGR
ncbi:MAG: cache domain-containing protein [Bdellovibrionales bacterium]